MSLNVSLAWVPVFDKYRYRPFGIHFDFIQNALELIFLLLFVYFWSWGALLILLYYLSETLVMWLFTAIKLWPQLKVDSDRFRRNAKLTTLVLVTIVLGCISWGQVHVYLGFFSKVMTVPSWYELVFGNDEYLFGLGAILLQQMLEHLKWVRLTKNKEFIVDMDVRTPIVRIVLQQVSVLIAGVFACYTISYFKVDVLALFVACILGGAKMIFGQLHLRVISNKV